MLIAVAADPRGACAQTDATTDPDKASEELRRIERDLETGRSTRSRLDRLSRDLAREIDRLRRRMADAATRQQRTEQTVSEVEATLATLREQAGETRALLAGRRLELGRLTGALQRLARRPPETLLILGHPPLETVRTGILLESVIPRINAEAARLRAELAGLATLEGEIRDQRRRLDEAAETLDLERARLAALASEKAELLDSTRRQARTTAEQVAALADSARSLRGLVDSLQAQAERERLEQQRLTDLVNPKEQAGDAAAGDAAAADRVPRPTPRPSGGADQGTALALLPGAPPISGARGQLFKPAAGRVIQGFGDTDPEGLRNHGLVLRTRPAATVVAPYDGAVIYAGPFEGFGLILIIEHGEGYLTLLAGLGRIDLSVGQRVLAGEPVGAMAGDGTGGGGGSDSELYVELRHKGDPIDPLPWIAGLTGKAKG